MTLTNQFLKITTLLIWFVFGHNFSNAQTNIVNGRVVKAGNGQPLPGTTLTIMFAENKNQNILVDKEGYFSLSLRGDIVSLSISHIGYQSKQVSKNGLSDGMIIELEPATTHLDEVILSTGYQTLPAERATGSFEYVSKQQLESRFSTDVLSRLDGMIPGVLFRRSTQGTFSSDRLSVRGVSTLSANHTQPLIVLDNFPYEGDLANINPNDIESVTILKDAAAASIWGARAGNGVLVITTKQQKAGQGFKMTATSNFAVTEKPDLFFRKRMTSSDFIDVERFLFEQGAYDANLNNTRNWPVITPVVEILQLQRQGLLTEGEASQKIDALRQYDIRNDIDRYINRDALARQYHVSMGMGGAKLSQQVTIGYDDNRGSTIGSTNNRFSLRSRTQFEPLKGLSMQFGLVATQRASESNTPAITMGTGSGEVYPYARLADENGTPLVLERDYRLDYARSTGGGLLLDWLYRPLEEGDYLDNSSQNRHIQLLYSAKYQPFDGFAIQFNYNTEQGITYGRNYASLETYTARNLINRFTQIDGETTRYAVPMGGVLDESHSRLGAHALRGHIDFDRSWGDDKHNLVALLGGEVRESRRLNSTGRTYGYDDNLLTHQVVDYVSLHPIYDNLSSNTAIDPHSSFSGFLNRFVSIYSNASYSFSNKYILSASARKDASNLFGVKTNNKWKPLWSLGLAWALSEERFFNWKFLPHLKIRATYGYSGNVNNTVAALTTIVYGSYPTQVARLQSATINNPPNPQLRWEQVATLNLGVDFRTRADRLSGSMEYYRKKSSDLIAYVPIDPTTGYLGTNMNVASLVNEGLDIRLASVNTVGLLRWTSTAYFSRNRDRVLDVFYEREYANQYIQHGTTLTAIKEYPLYPVISYAWAGLDPQTGDPRGYADGQVSTDYRTILNGPVDNTVLHGNGMPQVHGALSNHFSFKQFALSFDVTYRMAYFFRRESVGYSGLLSVPTNVQHGDYYDRWKKPGDELHTNVPSQKYPADGWRDQFYLNSAVNVERGDHVRLQNIQFSYHIDHDMWRYLPVRRMSFSLYASNLGIVWRANDKKLDPDFTTYPSRLTVACGIKMDF